MHIQIIIHFANIFERANFNKLILPTTKIKKLTTNFCLIDKYTNIDTYDIREHCPTSKILIKHIQGKRTTYTEWR